MKAPERVAKYQAAVEAEQAEIDDLTTELHKMMSPKNPRATVLRRRRRQAQGRLYTAKRRLADAEAAQ